MFSIKPNAGLELDLRQASKLIVSHGEGEYIEVPNQAVVREGLGAFLPHAKEETVSILFEHVIEGRERACRSKPVVKRNLPVTEINRFEAAIRGFLAKADSPQTVPKA